MLLGVQVSAAGRIYEAVERAHQLGCNTMQLFARNPQRWRDNFLESEDTKKFIKERENFKIGPVFIHIPYIINLASPNPRLYQASIEAFIEDVLEAHTLKVDYIVTHTGSHKDTSEDAGLARLIQALNIIMDRTKNVRVGILLENTAGSGSWLGYNFEHHKRIIQGLVQKERIGLCLDTAHAYLAGYDISTKTGLEATLAELDRLVGINLVKLVHLNDAKGKLGSRHDRHEHIGKGHIRREGIKRVINHPTLRNLPFILETPKDTKDADEINLNLVRSLRY